jgi:catechol 2,3-dioxygenase-like lactoylglutathione lyase family enzyme
MIDALDHVTLAVADLPRALGDYAALLGCEPDGNRFRLGNIALDLVAASAAGLAGITFATRDLAKAHRLLGQRALAPEQRDVAIALPVAQTYGIPIALTTASAGNAPPADPGVMTGLDHLVIGTPDPERAIVLYAGRLGLDLRLDRSNPDWGMRLLFFRCGDLVVEVAHRLAGGATDGPDRFYGFSWRVADIAAAHTRITAAGFNVSEIRSGRRPGTRVFTVHDRTHGAPTIVLGPTGQ